MDVMIDYYDRRLGLSDAGIEPFTGLVDYGAPPDPALLRDLHESVSSWRRSVWAGKKGGTAAE